MATRGPEGRAPLPSAVTSPSDDNKPRPGGDPTRTDDYLDFEGNVRPRSAHGAPSASEGKAVDGRDRRRDAKRGQREETPQGTRKFNNFNYWRKKLPDVTREIQYILTPKSARRSLRRDVNGNEGDASFSASPEAKADPREAGLRERRNLGSLAVGKPSKHSAWEEEDELEEEEGRRGKGKGKGRRPATPRRHHAAAGLVPYAFVECAGESSTDDFEYIPGAGRDGPRVGHEAPDRRGDRGADDDDEEDEEVAELEDDHFRALAVDRPKSGSFSYYSGLVSLLVPPLPCRFFLFILLLSACHMPSYCHYYCYCSSYCCCSPYYHHHYLLITIDISPLTLLQLYTPHPHIQSAANTVIPPDALRVK